jgi:chorismate mutase
MVVMTRGRPSGLRYLILPALLAAGLVTAPAAARADAPALTELLDAAAQRLQTADAVAGFKWNTHGAIEDPARVRQELAALGSQATSQHIDRGYVTRVFSDQINATTAIEYSRFADWTFDPSDVPAAPPDLAASRSAIDGLNQTMLTQIARNWDLLHSPACAGQLGDARADVVGARHLDDLYQRALSRATQSYCA